MAISESAIKAGLRRMKANAKARQAESFELAIDYLEGRALEDVRGQLDLRYRSTQRGNTGERIAPVCIPLVERYISEAADLYNHEVKRELVDESGDVNADATSIYNDELRKANNNEYMHRLEQLVVLLGSCGLWTQYRRGKIKPRVVVPHLIHPVISDDAQDASDPEDYLGHVIELATDQEDETATNGNQFVFIAPAEHVYFSAGEWTNWDGGGTTYKNPFMWPQADESGRMMSAPLQMLTFWHRRLPIDELITDTDPEIVYLNRELNVQWSVLLDTIRTQGFSQMVLKLINPDNPPARVPVGTRFALPIMERENAEFITASNNYSELVDALQQIVKLMAISKRMSPSDFATDGKGPESGFAKIVASLPKIEARNELMARFKAMEEQQLWPRQCSILQYAGKLPSGSEKLRLRVKFSAQAMPQTVDETVKKQEHDFRFNLSTPARLLSEQLGISIDEAQAIVDENTGKNKTASPQQGPAPTMTGSIFGGLAGRTASRQA